MIATVQKWGNSLAVRIPKSVAQDIHLASGVPVNLTVHEGQLLVSPERAKTYQLGQLLKQVSGKNLHGETDFGHPEGNEVW